MLHSNFMKFGVIKIKKVIKKKMIFSIINKIKLELIVESISLPYLNGLINFNSFTIWFGGITLVPSGFVYFNNFSALDSYCIPCVFINIYYTTPSTKSFSFHIPIALFIYNRQHNWYKLLKSTIEFILRPFF